MRMTLKTHPTLQAGLQMMYFELCAIQNLAKIPMIVGITNNWEEFTFLQGICPLSL